ncbi:sigma 54 modulation/S30EA ribosomal C-terminal domain-containing protein [Nocardia sp. NBC_01503]|uniref:sigma 54 modulation/S30EA ribosomal C-terminal domain-containing protein n=1 Tax=Nocardia sp. NBC_01503 TaxID=2975997 RepID=UPI002E7B456F|nr:sigma 54 modulation/S30EA ribosomal C-terminal domain-containing protein [Nocardia sp. NBC_01503]WTL30600.1 sigma 54 modulation/S30EA ribosomal C-terminal domain-containing protein [Nocardia sp. NBC_01503]
MSREIDLPGDSRIDVRGTPLSEECTQAAERTVRDLLGSHCVAGPVTVRFTTMMNNRLLVQINVRTRLHTVRVQLLDRTEVAFGLAVHRLDEQLTRLAAGILCFPWHHQGSRLTRASDVRPIVRRKLCGLRTCTPGDAAEFLRAMNFDAHLFIDQETGLDAVVHRDDTGDFVDQSGATSLRLIRQTTVGPVGGDPVSSLLYAGCAEVLEETAAMRRLCDQGLPFLFFTDRYQHRGRLLYRRYDRDLGLVVPVESGVSRDE